MPSIWNVLPSSKKDNTDFPPLKGRGKSKSSNDIFKNSGGYEQRKKLTRQRKLRHVTDEEVGLSNSGTNLPDGPHSWPMSPESCSAPSSGAPTPNHGGGGNHWSRSAVPLPLPLPDMNSQPKFSDFSAVSSNSAHQESGKETDDVGRRSYVSPTYRRRGFPQELNVDTAQNDFRLHFPTKSAPSSPQRYSTVDLFHPLFKPSSGLGTSVSDRFPKSYQSSLMPTPEHSPRHSPHRQSTSDRFSKSYQPSLMPTPEHSPRHSPHRQSTSDNGHSRNYNGPSMPWHNKSMPESSAAWPDSNNATVHPLPRPPMVSRPSSSSQHSLDRSDVSSVRGQWQRGKLIGRGTYGSVYIATHRETGATCAVKEVDLIPDDPKCAECIKQLEQEMKFLRELKHPNIVQYYGCEIIEDRFCIYLEYVHPGSINKYVNEHCGAITESIVRNFTRHILSGLAYLHSTKTIHRDIKGANLLVDASGVVKLADFGLAKPLAGQNIDLSLKGTPHWMAPEVLQAIMRKDASPEFAYGLDIWSVGCTVIEMLTGKPPWGSFNNVQAMFNVLKKAPPIPEALSDEGKDFLRLCFQRRPEDRPSAAKLLEHPFLQGLQEQNVGLVQEISGIKLSPTPGTIQEVRSPNDRSQRHKDVSPLPLTKRIPHEKLPHSSETNRQSRPETSESGAIPYQSPRSTLEVLQCISSPEFGRSSNNTSPSNVQKNLLVRGANASAFKGNYSYLIPKMTGRHKESR